MKILSIGRLQTRIDELFGKDEAFFVARDIWRNHLSVYAFAVFGQIVICVDEKRKEKSAAGA